MQQLPAIVEKINSVFENDSTEPVYDYCENLNDGRGYTFGKIGFTTANGDGYDLIKAYCQDNPNSELAQYLPTLQQLANDEDDDTDNLPNFAEVWQQEAASTVAHQDAMAFEVYGKPAQDYCNKLGLTSTMALAFFYDTVVQHGDGDDDDSISAILARTIEEMGGTLSGTNEQGNGCHTISDPEINFLDCFLVKRKECLMNPANEDTTEEWRESADRVTALKNLLDTENMMLTGSIAIKSNDWNTNIA